MAYSPLSVLSDRNITATATQSPNIECEPIKKFSQVFGAELIDLPLTYVEEIGGSIPSFVVELGAYLMHNVGVEGLFRKTGSLVRQREMRRCVERGDSLTSILQCSTLYDSGQLRQDGDAATQGEQGREWRDRSEQSSFCLPPVIVHDLANLLKQFLRELPQPLFTSHLQSHFLRLAPTLNASSGQSDGQMSLLCALLPEVNRYTLKYVATLLRKVALSAQSNYMNEDNLSVVFAPNLVRNATAEETEAHVRSMTHLVRYLIEHAFEIDQLPTQETLQNWLEQYADSNVVRRANEKCVRFDSATDKQSLAVNGSRKRTTSLKTFVSDLIKRHKCDHATPDADHEPSQKNKFRRCETLPHIGTAPIPTSSTTRNEEKKSDNHTDAPTNAVQESNGPKSRVFCFSSLRKRSASASPCRVASRKVQRSASPLVDSRTPPGREASISHRGSPSAIRHAAVSPTVVYSCRKMSALAKQTSTYSVVASPLGASFGSTGVDSPHMVGFDYKRAANGVEESLGIAYQECRKENDSPTSTFHARCDFNAQPKLKRGRPVFLANQEEKHLILRERLCKAVTSKVRSGSCEPGHLLLGDRIKMMKD